MTLAPAGIKRGEGERERERGKRGREECMAARFLEGHIEEKREAEGNI